MKEPDFLVLMEELLEMEPKTLSGSDVLSSLAVWDSFAIISFMAFADEQFGARLGASQIAACRTVTDLEHLFGDQIEGAAAGDCQERLVK